MRFCFDTDRRRLGLAGPPDFGSAAHAQQKISAVPAAVPRDCGELFAMPLNDHPRADGKRPLDADACPGFGCVFQDRRHTKGYTAIVLPYDLGDRPHHLPWFDVAPVHAMCIGSAAGEFSYLRLRRNYFTKSRMIPLAGRSGDK